ncbi:MAG TPA: hypothetical protein VHC49_10500 [Mycobacteriales bacterium]|nr:hypothetical protein [Mycobacteriales bacterium]
MMFKELLVAVVVIGGLALAARWAFRPSTPRLGARPRIGDRGLLRPVAHVPNESAARSAQTVLTGAGIRCTSSPTADGRIEILVFPADLDRARSLLLDLEE